MNKQKLYFSIKILSMFGIFLACYLLFEQIVQRPVRPCSINATINCDAVISGPVAKTLGIPTPIYGLVGYIVIFIAAIKKNNKFFFP
ncbi:vitamin K epoxide reductase family protein, partial [Candidatus Microgenomates bacterium]|nr:vitamin K epoxide reductase family protein [Candidatus Microgenomates bacterium]